ncbi:MAG: hypothetical protein CMM30_02200 [Rhodospirillaceae bacterium]|nr:hypothetical protein [Rhodospirillaceae bacterium]|tara:strand:+ start:2407 stop:2862 length:456 start_codon:yes stop_codon:yes gene_type:complete
MAFFVGLHTIAAVVWVGGMFLAYTAVRPAAMNLSPEERFKLWKSIGAKFFPVVGVCCIILVATGYGMIFEALGGFSSSGIHVHIMQGTGWLMIGLFGHLISSPYRKLVRSLKNGNTQDSAKALASMRRVVGINLLIGIATILIGATGRYWA